MNRPRTLYVTPEDLALLTALTQEGSLAAAARSAGMTRDRGVYRLARLARIARGPVVTATRGGRGHGTSRLTARGRALLRRGSDLEGSAASLGPGRSRRWAVLTGRFTRTPFPAVRVTGDLRLAVGFTARDGERVRLVVPAESVLVARHRFPTSARNVLIGTVGRQIPLAGDLVRLEVRVGSVRFPSLVTRRALRELAVRRGSSVVLYIKATSIRRA